MAKVCEHCGKDDYDDPTVCKNYTIFTQGIGDWACTVNWEERLKQLKKASK